MELPESFDTSAFGGFNKKAVLNYIDELCERAKEKEEELTQQIAEKQAENRSLNDRIQTLESAAEKSSEHKSTLEETIAELDRELRRQRSVAETYEQELRQQQDKCRQLSARAETLELKSKKYDEAMFQIGGAFMDARQNAAQLLKDAEDKAGQITKATMESVQSLTNQIGGFKGDISTLRKTLQMTMAELAGRLDDLDGSIDSLGEAVLQRIAENTPVQESEMSEMSEMSEIPEVPEASEQVAEAPAEREAAPALAGEPTEQAPKAEPPQEPVAEPAPQQEPAAAGAPRFFW